jgi:hypothetical protein
VAAPAAGVERGVERGGRRGEGDAEGVADGLEEVAVVRLDGLAQEEIVARQQRGQCAGVLLRQAHAALDVGE